MSPSSGWGEVRHLAFMSTFQDEITMLCVPVALATALFAMKIGVLQRDQDPITQADQAPDQDHETKLQHMTHVTGLGDLLCLLQNHLFSILLIHNYFYLF